MAGTGWRVTDPEHCPLCRQDHEGPDPYCASCRALLNESDAGRRTRPRKGGTTKALSSDLDDRWVREDRTYDDRLAEGFAMLHGFDDDDEDA